MRRWSLLLPVALLALLACSPAAEEGCSGDSENEYCKPVMEAVPSEGKADSTNGNLGLPPSVDGSATAVWEVRNQWADVDTPAAREAGMAWAADSGLDWDQKYAAWIRAMEKIPGESYYQTFQLITPWGRTLPAPNLECAEVALFLRATFASWYQLPFYVEAWEPQAGRIYLGHFGVRTKDGAWAGLPSFKTAYTDHTGSWSGGAWPSDSKLRSRKLAKNGDDLNEFLGAEQFAGAYFDELFLNKRTGHFLHYLLLFTGSMHLASTDNTFNLVPQAMREGDVLLERWQRKGIGHTLVVKKVDRLEGWRLDAELASGSMPRRQPKWENGPSSKSTFTNDYCGGEGANYEGEAYAALGGGLKRWRVAKVVNGVYSNTVPAADQGNWIPHTDLKAIAARVQTLKGLLGELSPAEKREMLVAKIEDKRAHLRDHPASCSARIGREEAFTELYELMQGTFGLDRAAVDKQYRALEDYVFAELVYELSRTCCWNSTTRAMYDIAMELNRKLAFDPETQTCSPVQVFRVKDGGYGAFLDYAISVGRGDEWLAWSADEECPQATVEDDTEEVHGWTAQCDIIGALVQGVDEPGDTCTDTFAGNDDREHATAITPGTYPGLWLCSGEEDWFALALGGAAASATIRFEQASGDLDLEAYDAQGEQIAFSNGSSDSEQVAIPAGHDTVYLRVFGYQNAVNAYLLVVE